MELLISPLRLCGHVCLQLRWLENELWAFDWCPAPLLAIVSPADMHILMHCLCSHDSCSEREHSEPPLTGTVP